MSDNKQQTQTPEELRAKYGLDSDQIAWIQRQNFGQKSSQKPSKSER